MNRSWNDTIGARTYYCLIKRTAGNHAVVVVEHDMQFVRRLECRVTVLHEGSVLAEGSYEFVTNNKDVIDVYLGR